MGVRNKLRSLERACFTGDPVLLGKGNVVYRMDDLVKRRKNASLAGQHRDTQRLDKEIMLLRAALGLPKLPPEEVIRTHTTSKDPTNGENLVIASAESDVDWMRRITTRALARLDAKLGARGYEYASTSEGSLNTYTWRSGQGRSVSVTAIGRSWIVSASRDGKRLNSFNFSESADEVERGIPMQMTASHWNGQLEDFIKQAYASDLAKLLKDS